MFHLLPGKGFALTFANRVRAEIDFGPLSQSENKNISKEAFKAANGNCGTAEVRIYKPGDGSQPSVVHDNVKADTLVKLLAAYGYIDVPPMEPA